VEVLGSSLGKITENHKVLRGFPQPLQENAGKPLGLLQPEELGKLKNHHISYQTCDLLVCSIVN
jgi:hypothetical protein